jgi:hypothetical protein
MESLADPSKWGDLDEKDPKSMAKMMKRLGREFGEELGEDADQMVDEALDEEMAERILRHRKSRSGDWQTLEEPIKLTGCIGEEGYRFNLILLDCLTLWISNLISIPWVSCFVKIPF